jgi:hypothetical protein
MAIKHLVSEGARLRLEEIARQSVALQVEAAEILTRETAGMELDALAQQELRALQMMAEAHRSGALDQYFSNNVQGGREMSAGLTSTVINQLADRLPQAEASSPVSDE